MSAEEYLSLCSGYKSYSRIAIEIGTPDCVGFDCDSLML